MIEFEQPSLRSEVIGASVRVLSVAPQAIEFLVRATMIQFEVHAELVSSNSNALRRFHYFQSVTFTDDGLAIIGEITWPDETVVFTDGETGDDGLVIFIPITVDGADETVTFTEDQFASAWAISNTEFVRFMDFAISYVFDLLLSEIFSFADFSIAWTGQHRNDESVFTIESWTGVGGNAIALGESVNISEILYGANSFVFGDAVTLFEFWDFYPSYPVIFEYWTVTDALVVSEVAATDSRPGAFVPGSALLGSPQ